MLFVWNLEGKQSFKFQPSIVGCNKHAAWPCKLRNSETPNLQSQERPHRHSKHASLANDSLAQATESLQSQRHRLLEAQYLGRLVVASAPSWGEVSEGK